MGLKGGKRLGRNCQCHDAIGRSRINTTTIVASLSDCGQYGPLWTARREMSTAESTEDKGDRLKGKAQSISDCARTRFGVVVVGGQDGGPGQK